MFFPYEDFSFDAPPLNRRPGQMVGATTPSPQFRPCYFVTLEGHLQLKIENISRPPLEPGNKAFVIYFNFTRITYPRLQRKRYRPVRNRYPNNPIPHVHRGERDDDCRAMKAHQ